MAHRRPLTPVQAEQNLLKPLSQEEMEQLKKRNQAARDAVQKKTQLRAASAKSCLNNYAVLIGSHEIETLTDRMARQISHQLQYSAPLVLTLYSQGYSEGAHFANHLTQKLDSTFPLETAYIDFDLDGKTLVEPTADLQGRTVLIVDGACTNGKKIQWALDYCELKNVRIAHVAVMVDMPAARATELRHLKPGFVAYRHPGKSTLVGFGFDVNGFFRNEPRIYMEREAVSNTLSIHSTLTAASQDQAQPLLYKPEIPTNQAALDSSANADETFVDLPVLYGEAEIEKKMQEVAEKMRAEFKDEYPIVITMQRGGTYFTTRLSEMLSDSHHSLMLEECSMHITRYGHSQTGGKARIVAKPTADLTGRTVIICDDVIEGGLTMQLAISLCLKGGAAKVYVASLGDKLNKRLPGLGFIQPDFCCFRADSEDNDGFWVGWGLDEKDFFRNAKEIRMHPPTEKTLSEAKAGVKAAPKTTTAAPLNTWRTLGPLVLGGLTVGAALFAAKRMIEAPTTAATAVNKAGISIKPVTLGVKIS